MARLTSHIATYARKVSLKGLALYSHRRSYEQQVILSVVGVPGALIAGWMVDLPYLGRKGTLATSSSTCFHTARCSGTNRHLCPVVTGVLLFAATTARSSNALLGWNCGYSVTNNIMYGVLYAMSPEVFPAKDRGTGSALVSSANHLCGALVSPPEAMSR